MLITLLYHKAGAGRYATPISQLKEHFAYISDHYPTLWPKDPIKGQSVCLTFDDATKDFVEVIYPILERYHLKSVLAVPTRVIDGGSKDHCSWRELKSLAQGGLVHLASHSHSHSDMTTLPLDDLRDEYTHSKELIERHTGVTPTTFVFPYGRCNRSVIKEGKREYETLMRIGSGVNFKWDRLIYRINADGLTRPDFPFPIGWRYFGSTLVNKLRGK